MQWSQIKTLFILCFLVLDVYLIFQFLEKREAADLSLLEPENATLEERLEDEKITIKRLPETQPEDAFMSVKQKELSKSQINKLKDLSNQEAASADGKYIISHFKKPLKLSDNDSSETIYNKLRKEIMGLKEYHYGEWNKEANVILFFQEKNNRPVYFNQSGMVAVFLNDKNEAVGYFQSMLSTPEKYKDKKSLIKPMDAIGKLYENNLLNSGDEVSEVKIGYYTVVPLTNGVQVFAPTWKVTVNDKRSYFVNAIEGGVISKDDMSFLGESVKFIKAKLGELDHDKAVNKEMRKLLSEKEKLFNRSDTQ